MRYWIPAIAVLVTLLGPLQAGAAQATTPVTGQTITCNKMTGFAESNVTFKGKVCSPKPPKGYGNLTGPADAVLQSGGTLNWSGSSSNAGFITIGPVTQSAPPPKACPKGWIGSLDTATVTSTSLDPYNLSMLNSSVSLTVCVKGLKMKLGGKNTTL
jgi:hypothetical protein